MLKKMLKNLKECWERAYLSLRSLMSRKYGPLYLALIIAWTLALMAFLIWFMYKFWWLLFLIIFGVIIWYSEHPAPQISEEDSWGLRIAEEIARTLKEFGPHFGIVSPQKVADVFPLGRGLKDNAKGYTEYRYVFFAIEDGVDCDAIRDLLQRSLDRAFAGAPVVIVVTEVRESLFDARGYDVIVALNPPVQQRFPAYDDGWNGRDIIFDRDFRK